MVAAGDGGRVVVLGAGAVGVATAWHLVKAGFDVTVVERQEAAALETSWGNGGVIHASEVEPWSQPGMPRKILGWLGDENAPLLVRYGALPKIGRWGLDYVRNCTPERFRANTLANLALALHSLSTLQEIGAETGIRYDRATRGVVKIYRDRGSLDAATRGADELARHGLVYERLDAAGCVAAEPALSDTAPTLAGGLYFPRDEVGDCNRFTQGLAAACADRGATFRMTRPSVQGLVVADGRVASVRTDRDRIEADDVVVALGAFTAPLLRQAGRARADLPGEGRLHHLRRGAPGTRRRRCR